MPLRVIKARRKINKGIDQREEGFNKLKDEIFKNIQKRKQREERRKFTETF